MALQSSLSTEIDMLNDSDEEREGKERSATSLCAGWRTPLRKKGTANILHQRKSWL